MYVEKKFTSSYTRARLISPRSHVENGCFGRVNSRPRETYVSTTHYYTSMHRKISSTFDTRSVQAHGTCYCDPVVTSTNIRGSVFVAHASDNPRKDRRRSVPEITNSLADYRQVFRRPSRVRYTSQAFHQWKQGFPRRISSLDANTYGVNIRFEVRVFYNSRENLFTKEKFRFEKSKLYLII